MHITDYEFGSLEIDGRAFTSDVIVFPNKVIDHWWRKEGHSLAVEDLAEVLKAKPAILIIGTGYYGRLRVPEATRKHLESLGISLRQAKTTDAVKEFNRLQGEYARVVAALHLTC